MALFKPFRGNRDALEATEKHDGYAYFCVDDGTFHIDCMDADGNLQRVQINQLFIQQLLNITDNVGYLDAGRIIETWGGEANG